MNILLLSEATNRIKDFLESENLSVAYVASLPESDNKQFECAKEFYRELGGYELEYFDLTSDSNDFREIRRTHAIHLADAPVPASLRYMRERNFKTFLKDYLYIGGKLIAIGRSTISLATNVSLCREFSEMVPVRSALGMSMFEFEVFPFFKKESNTILRLQTLSTHGRGRLIYGIDADSGIVCGKGEFKVLGNIMKFYQGEHETLQEELEVTLHSAMLTESNEEESLITETQPIPEPIAEYILDEPNRSYGFEEKFAESQL